MSSGSAADVNNAGTLGRGTRSVNVNGNRSYSTNISLDGNTMYYAHRGAALVEPPPDAVEEIKVITSGVNAEYGRGSAVVSMITKSGTNEFHGSLYDYFRNDNMDGRSFFSRSWATCAARSSTRSFVLIPAALR